MRRVYMSTADEGRGFALLITIVLLSFLVLLLVSLATITRVETQIATSAAKLSVARQNAIFSLNLALGRMQESAGPDDRITASSTLTPSVPFAQSSFTGVWKTSNLTGVPDAWLVSGDIANPADSSSVLDPSTETELHGDGGAPWVFLVGDGTVGDAASRVRVACRPITVNAGMTPGVSGVTTIGSYAWWVGDQGVKASAELVDPLRLPDPISYNNSGDAIGEDWSDLIKRDRLNQLQPSRPYFERLFVGLAPDDVTTAGQLKRVQQLAQLDLIPSGPTALQRKGAFHSISPLSSGVLLDQRTSPPRLRRDLSDLSGTITPSGLGQAIRAFQQYRVSIPDSTKPYEAVYRPARPVPASGLTFPVFSAGPVLSEFGLRAFFTLSATNEILLNFIIEAELWNPYAARLEVNPSEPLSLVWTLGQELIVTVNDDQGGTHSVNIASLLRNANGTGLGIVIEPSEVWKPGEIRTVSGSTTLSTGGGFGSIPTGVIAKAGSTSLPTVKLPALGAPPLKRLELNLRINLAAGPAVLQQYNLRYRAFNAATVTNDGATPAFGYGYDLFRRLRRWTFEWESRDPRRPQLDGSLIVSSSTSRWAVEPADNAFQSPDGAFFLLRNVVFYDLPRQELVSVGELRQMVGENPAEMGNSAGGADNDWFDKYYFSTVPRNHAWDFNAREPLPNRYLRYLPSDRGPATLTDLRDDENAARFLMIHGAFNLNSTSIDAWRTVLGSRLVDWQGVATGAPETLENVFLRLPHGAQQAENLPVAGPGQITNEDAVTTGGRRLTETQITAMATSIVNGLKARGRPFMAIRSFLNDVGGGALIHKALAHAQVTQLNGTTVDARDDASATPGAVTQADVAAQLAPFLTARSDTFIVRAYGDTRNPVDATVAARAWCEAVVQRMPDVTDPAVGTYAVGDEIQIDPVKYPFGRKFKIISFRWLSPGDI